MRRRGSLKTFNRKGIKNKIMETFFKTEKIFYYENSFRIKELKKKKRAAREKKGSAWTTLEEVWGSWKNNPFFQTRINKEKIIYEYKIELFLEKLKDRSRNFPEKKALKNAVTNNALKTNRALKKFESFETYSKIHERTEGLKRNEPKKIKLTSFVKDLKECHNESFEKLAKAEKENKINNDETTILKATENEKIPRKIAFTNSKFLLRIEKRVAERSKRRKEIQERKLMKERENIRKLPKKEVKKNADARKAKLKEEREKAKEEKERKAKIVEQWKAAREQHRKVLLRSYGLGPWKTLKKVRTFQWECAESFARHKLTRNVFFTWKLKARALAEHKCLEADGFYDKLLSKRYFAEWVKSWRRNIWEIQVAEDWHDSILIKKTFGRWVNFVLEEQLSCLTKLKIAESHSITKIKNTCMKKWKQYLEVKRQTIAKEKRKEIWRRKVREILPDYRPTDLLEEK